MCIRDSSSNDQLVGANGKLIRDAENSENLPFLFGDFKSKSFLSLKKDLNLEKIKFYEPSTFPFYQEAQGVFRQQNQQFALLF